MSIEPGQRLLHYEIVEKIGEGGMGVVWSARDTKLERQVAIKILPDEFASDEQRLARFEREAKMLATLNHPNVAGIHGFEQAGGVHFLVLELIEGETLQQILEQGRLPIEDALEICRQVAEGLEAAHQAGVIHRDLKPGNIKVTPNGKAKVLDFGLAKGVAGTAGSSTDLSMSPTVTVAADTQAGVVLGTAPYMSPEQARGKPMDRRTDIWSFGCVLYEMLTGHKAFAGDTVSDTLASVLTAEPNWHRLPAETPRALRRLLRRCLEKDTACRLRDAGDARLELNDAANAPPGEDREATASAPTRPLMLPAVAALALVAGMVSGVIGVRILTPSAPEPPVRRLVIPIDDLVNPDERLWDSILPAISADGSRIAWVADGTVYIRRLDQATHRPVEGLANASTVFWSPDGAQLGVAAGRELWRVAPDTRRAALISEMPGNVIDAGWGPDGAIVTVVEEEKIYTVPARGGDPVKIADRESEGVEGYYGLTVPPDGRGFVVSTVGATGEAALELRDGDRTVQLLSTGSANYITTPRYAQSGHLLYLRFGVNAGLWALPVKRGATEPTGDPFLVLPGFQPGSASADGTLVYIDRRRSGMQEIVWATLDGEVESTLGEPRQRIRDVIPSPDGTRVAFTAGDGEHRDLWVHDLSMGTNTRLTFDEGRERSPVWSADGAILVYSVSEVDRPYSPTSKIFSMESDGSGSPWPLADGSYPDISRDGKTLLFSRLVETGWDVYSRSLDEAANDEHLRIVLNGAADEHRPRLSPDGRWLAYVSNETGRRQIHVASFPAGDDRRQVSFKGGEDPRWSVDGEAIYFEWARRLYKVEVVQRGGELSVSSARLLLDGVGRRLHPWWGYHVSADGTRVLTVREVEEEDPSEPMPSLRVVENWVRAVRESDGGSRQGGPQ